MRLGVVVSVALAAALAGAPALATQVQFQLGAYRYTAQTSAPALQQGNITAGGITWACAGSACTVTGPWPQPGVAACRALANQVGRIASYGRAGAMLSAADLALCNAGQLAQGSGRSPSSGPNLPPPAAQSGPLTVNTPQLSFVGGAQSGPPVRGPAVVIATSELSFIGGATTPRGDAGAAVEVTTQELSFVGCGGAVSCVRVPSSR